MTLAAKESERLVAFHGGAVEKAQHTAHLLVQLLSSIFSFPDKLLVRKRHIVVVVCVGCTHGETIGPRTELKVESVLDSLLSIVTSAPVAYYHTVKTPVLLQNLVEHGGVVAVVHTLIEVVGTHDGPCPTLLNGSLEGRQINLVQSAVAYYHVNLMAILLVVVQRVVLYAGSNALRL